MALTFKKYTYHLFMYNAFLYNYSMRQSKNYTPVPGMRYSTCDESSKLQAYLRYGQCPVSRYPDKGGLSVL